MTSWLLLCGRFLSHLFGWQMAEMEGAPIGEKKGLPAWAIILIVIGAVLAAFCLIVVCVIIVLALLGPAVGNTFSNIILEI